MSSSPIMTSSGKDNYWTTGSGDDVIIPIIYVEGDNFHPEILDRVNFPKHNIETFFAGKEVEHMLRIREERLVKKD